jgi:hypothetical protein
VNFYLTLGLAFWAAPSFFLLVIGLYFRIKHNAHFMSVLGPVLYAATGVALLFLIIP